MINADLDFNREALLEKISVSYETETISTCFGCGGRLLNWLTNMRNADPKKASLAALL